MEWLDVVTSPPMWIAGAILAGNSLLMTLLMLRVSRRTAKEIGLSDTFVVKTLRTGAVASLGPSMGSFIGMVVLVVALGGAIAWIREAAGIGSVSFELMMAQSGATAAGVQLTREGMTLIGAATIVWGMALTCIPWVLTGGVGARLLPRLRDSALGRKPGLMALVSAAAMLGMFAKFLIDYGVKPVQTALAKPTGGPGWANPAALVAGLVAGCIWLALAERLHKPELKQFLIIIGIVAGMVVGQIVATI